MWDLSTRNAHERNSKVQPKIPTCSSCRKVTQWLCRVHSGPVLEACSFSSASNCHRVSEVQVETSTASVELVL